jgi:hypothetical protein
VVGCAAALRVANSCIQWLVFGLVWFGCAIVEYVRKYALNGAIDKEAKGSDDEDDDSDLSQLSDYASDGDETEFFR